MLVLENDELQEGRRCQFDIGAAYFTDCVHQ